LRFVGANCSDVVVRGNGPASTLLFAPTLPFRETFNDRAFYIESAVTAPVEIDSAIALGTRAFEVRDGAAAAKLERGEWVVVFDRDRRAKEIVTIDWAQVDSVSGRRVQVQRPFRTSFARQRPSIANESGLAFIRIHSLLENFELRDFKLVQLATNKSAAAVTIGMAIRTRLDNLYIDNARGNGFAIYRAKDSSIHDVTVLNGTEQANEIASTVDFRVVNCSFGFEGTSYSSGAGPDTAALNVDFGAAFFTISSNSFHSAGNIAVMMLDGVHDGTFVANSIGWTRDVGLGLGQGLSLRGTQRVIVRGNSFAGGDRGTGNVCIGVAHSDHLDVPMKSGDNIIADNLCPNYAHPLVEQR